MKLLILVFMLTSAHAENFLPDKESPTITYWDKIKCETIEKVKCFEIEHCPPEECNSKNAEKMTALENEIVERKSLEDKLKLCNSDAATDVQVRECLQLIIKRFYRDL